MQSKIGVGVIGLGYFGELHAKTYLALEETQLVAVADIDEEKAKAFANQYQVASYKDYRELLERKDVQAVSICTPDKLHLEPSIAAARAGKHILLEKPIASSLEEADKIIEAAKSAQVKLMIAHILRFDPRYHLAYRAIRRGEIGQIIHMYARRNNPATSGKKWAGRSSVILFLGIHDIDALRWFAGSEVERVYAESTSLKLKDWETEDTIFALLKFKSGTIASLECSWALPEDLGAKIDARLEVIGTEGALYIDVYDQGLRICKGSQMSFLDTMYWPEIAGRQVGILKEELAHFIHCLLYDRQPLITGEEGRAALRIVCAISQSLKESKPILT